MWCTCWKGCHVWCAPRHRSWFSVISLYTAEITAIAHRHSIGAHSYSDETQLHIQRKAEDLESSILYLELDEINCWMSANLLKLKRDKTSFISLDIRQQHEVKGNPSPLTVCIYRQEVTPKTMSPAWTWNSTTQWSFPRISSISPVGAFTIFIRCVLCVTRYSPMRQNTSQCVYNKSNRLLQQCCQSGRNDLSSPATVSTEYSGATYRKEAKVRHDYNNHPWCGPLATESTKNLICDHVYKAMHHTVPVYLTELCIPVSTVHGDLDVAANKGATCDRRSITVSGGTAWNALSLSTREQSLSSDSFAVVSRQNCLIKLIMLVSWESKTSPRCLRDSSYYTFSDL